jgi:putative transposase
MATSFVKVLRQPLESAQYTSGQFQRLMIDHGVLCSMSRSAKFWDLRQCVGQCGEGELLLVPQNRANRAKDVQDQGRGKCGVLDYIERFYHPKRKHSTIGYLSPTNFEWQAGFA